VTLARTVAFLGVLVGVGVSLTAAGCDARAAHLLEAYVYDPTNDCLEAPALVDVVNGPPPAAPCLILRCWLNSGGAALITDAACDVPPDYQDETSATTGPCVKALAAYGEKGHQLCPAPADAGSATGS
jgi:hypothetical protein